MITQRIERIIADVVCDAANDGDDRKMEKVQEMLRRAAVELGNLRHRIRQENFKTLRTMPF